MVNSYNNQIGYSPLNCINKHKMGEIIKLTKTLTDQYYRINKKDLILAAGAGSGIEAEIIKKEFKATTIGVDIHIQPLDNVQRNHKPSLCKQDLASIAIVDKVFSFVYCYHVLEHVVDHIEVLKEINRVLKPGGIMFIGFPNRKRIMSYINPVQNISLWGKIMWNLNDYIYRLKGKFDNRYGAHAGFAEDEFIRDAGEIFQEIIVVSDQYMKLKYERFGLAIKILKIIHLDKFIFPSNYFICKKGVA